MPAPGKAATLKCFNGDSRLQQRFRQRPGIAQTDDVDGPATGFQPDGNFDERPFGTTDIQLGDGHREFVDNKIRRRLHKSYGPENTS